MPPQGLLTIAAAAPKQWEVRFVDENVRSASESDFVWADAVFVSGMHIQQKGINRINELAHRYGKITVLGGPSVSSCPQYYPDFDLLHLGELGDATEELFGYLEKHTNRPTQQLQFRTKARLPLSDFPIPAYGLVNLDQYFMGSIQFSSGCPYNCEFRDIPELYGRHPRRKTPERIILELDAILAAGKPGAIYFVDDNFIADRRAALELVPHLVHWQKRQGYPVEFACEATLNIAKHKDLLAAMREAYFCTIFCGIETPEPAALKAMSKRQNLAVPLLESIRLLNSYGMEVVSGIILGLDTDSHETEERILQFIQLSQMPMLTINLLHALPNTPLWRRLEQENRLVLDETRESNVDFKLPYEQVVRMWRSCVRRTYEPDFLYARFLHNVKNTYSRRIEKPTRLRRDVSRLPRGIGVLLRILLQIGVRGRYRKAFWAMANKMLKSADLESFIHISLVAHHLIEFARECESGKESASFYAQNAYAQNALRDAT